MILLRKCIVEKFINQIILLQIENNYDILEVI